MPELSFQNIEDISHDVRCQEITFSHLADELIDHICCDVENEMNNGLGFKEAYKRVKQRMGPRRLNEIQEETLYAVDSKYRKMKNTMKISGIAGTIMFGFATLFKIQHWPFAGILMVLGAFILAFIFMPSALTVLWKETHNRKRLFLFVSGFVTGMLFIFGTLFKIQHWPSAAIILSLSVFFAVFFFIPSLILTKLADPANRPKKAIYIFGAAGCIMYVAGALFKIQHWPMASLFMVLAVIILFIVVLPWYTWMTWKDERDISASFIFLIIGTLLIVVPGALINLNLRNMYNNGYYPHLEQEQRLFEVRSGMNKSFLNQYHDSLCYSKMDLLHKKTLEALIVLGNAEKKIVEASEARHGNPPIRSESIGSTEYGTSIRYSHLLNPFDQVPSRDLLMPGCQVRQEMNNVLGEYMNYVTNLTPAIESKKISGLLDPCVYLPGNMPGHDDFTLLSALHSIEIMKNNLLAVESSMLTNIAKQ
jgi:hypothetical protein